MSILTVDAIREVYPHPISGMDENRYKGAYCVLGAILRAVDHNDDYQFPSARAVVEIARWNNPTSDLNKIRRIAEAVIEANDRHDFYVAWQVAGELLDLL